MPGYTLSKDDYLNRLSRIEGQVRGLQRMIDEDTYCIDILTQISSVTKALQGCLLYTSPSPRDREKSRMPSSA